MESRESRRNVANAHLPRGECLPPYLMQALVLFVEELLLISNGETCLTTLRRQNHPFSPYTHGASFVLYTSQANIPTSSCFDEGLLVDLQNVYLIVEALLLKFVLANGRIKL